jgi:hypothetical protein
MHEPERRDHSYKGQLILISLFFLWKATCIHVTFALSLVATSTHPIAVYYS